MRGQRHITLGREGCNEDIMSFQEPGLGVAELRCGILSTERRLSVALYCEIKRCYQSLHPMKKPRNFGDALLECGEAPEA